MACFDAKLAIGLLAGEQQPVEIFLSLGEFEERGGFLKWGLENCAEWLAWRCDLSMTTAREKVRVARSLKDLPAISASFSVGELSYAKVRALTGRTRGRPALSDAQRADMLALSALHPPDPGLSSQIREIREKIPERAQLVLGGPAFEGVEVEGAESFQTLAEFRSALRSRLGRG